MYALCVSGAVNTQGFVWKFFMRYIYTFSFIHSFIYLLLTPALPTVTVYVHLTPVLPTVTVYLHITPVLPTVTVYLHLKPALPTVTVYLHLSHVLPSHRILTPHTCTALILTPHTSPPTVTIFILTPDQHSDRPVLVSAFHLTAVQPRVTAADRLDVVN